MKCLYKNHLSFCSVTTNQSSQVLSYWTIRFLTPRKCAQQALLLGNTWTGLSKTSTIKYYWTSQPDPSPTGQETLVCLATVIPPPPCPSHSDTDMKASRSIHESTIWELEVWRSDVLQPPTPKAEFAGHTVMAGRHWTQSFYCMRKWFI